MAYIDLDTVHVATTGQVATAVWGLVVGDSLEALADRPACSVFASAGQAVPNNLSTVLDANSENYDTDAMHDTAANPSRITAVAAGNYLAWATVNFDAHAPAGGISNAVARVSILRNGGQSGLDTRPLAASPVEVRVSVVSLIPMTTGQHLEIQAFQTSGATGTVRLEEFGMLAVGR